MNDKPLDELSDQEFDGLIEGFITRPDDPVAPTTFLSALTEFLQGRTAQVVELTAETQVATVTVSRMTGDVLEIVVE